MKTPKKKKSSLMVVGILVVVIIVIIIILNSRKKDAPKDDYYEVPITPSGGSKTSSGRTGRQYDKNFNPNKVVGQGFYGTNAAMIQKAANRYRALYGLSPIAEDGDWGSGTQKAVSSIVSTPTSYAKVKKAVSNAYVKFGKADPYRAGKDVDGAQLISDVVTGKIFGK